MNARDLNIKSAYALYKNKKLKASIRVNKKNERVTFKFNTALYGNVELHISSEGENNDKMYGFYRSVYKNNGREEHMLSTQFEPVDARSAFVSFDEPAFKATFSLSLVIDSKLTAISNMPILKETQIGKGRKVVEFEKTPRMACYLLYMGVGKFERKDTNLGKLKISAVTIPGRIKLADMALDFCVRFVRFYQNYFGIKFPLPKIDIIAIPDFAAGAMENWGAITFRDVDMLGDTKLTTANARQRIAEVVAHELAHQWFGDLVTMRWWNDLWLNESFATFMSYKAMDSVFPEWKILKQYYIDIISLAMVADARNTTHPISVKVDTPAEIDSIFDPISYEKGGTVLHMLESYAGKTAFRKGLHDYLSDHEYGNAEGKDLWNAISKYSKKGPGKPSVSEFAETWITQKGYPIIKMRKSGSSTVLKQNRFCITGARSIKKAWPTPLDYMTTSSKTPNDVVMDKGSMTLKHASGIVKLNYLQNYMYRVDYPDDILEGVGERIKNGKSSSTDTWGVAGDLFALARSGMVPLKKYLDFVDSYCMDVEYPASGAITNGLAWVTMMTEGTKVYEEAVRISTKFHKNVIRRLGWNSSMKDSNIDLITRERSISSLADIDDKETVDKLLPLYDKLLAGHDVPKDKLSPALVAAARNGDMTTFNQIAKMYKAETFPEKKIKYLHSLGRFRDRKIVEHSLEFNMTSHVRIQDKVGRKAHENENVRIQDRVGIPLTASSDMKTMPVVWGWAKKNWSMIKDEFPESTHMLSNFVTVTYLMHTEKDLKEFIAFLSKKGNMRDDIKKEYNNTIESIKANIRFFKRNGLG